MDVELDGRIVHPHRADDVGRPGAEDAVGDVHVAAVRVAGLGAHAQVVPATCSPSRATACRTCESGTWGAMASYAVNERAVARARELINARQYVVRSEWGDVQPRAADENAFLEEHSWEEYAWWHLGLTDGVSDETKARYAFLYGDFRRVHRSGLIACHYRAAEWEHKEIELAAHDLLQLLDATRA